MTQGNSVEIVETFWREVWQARDPDAIDRLVAEDVVITSGDTEIRSRTAFKAWVTAFLAKIDDFDFQVIETFQNHAGDRVASRWRVTGKNNGFFDTAPRGAPINMSGTAIWHVREDGLLQHNWVERNAYEVHRRLTNDRPMA